MSPTAFWRLACSCTRIEGVCGIISDFRGRPLDGALARARWRPRHFVERKEVGTQVAEVIQVVSAEAETGTVFHTPVR